MNDKLYIKNMVCDRCKTAVKNALDYHHINYYQIDLGEVVIEKLPSAEKLNSFRDSIEQLGFELIEDKTARAINRIKNVVIKWVHGDTQNNKVKFSAYLSDALSKDYNYLSNLFSGVEGTTIEQYLILQKIERVKELLVYDELSLSEIANELHYSSVQHLSNQFKKVTGLTPSHFKKIGDQKRKPLDQV